MKGAAPRSSGSKTQINLWVSSDRFPARFASSQTQSTTPLTAISYISKTSGNMDLASLALGIAALYTTCRDCYDFFTTVRKAEAESSVHLRELQIQRSTLKA
jgi:hypothetical protein